MVCEWCAHNPTFLYTRVLGLYPHTRVLGLYFNKIRSNTFTSPNAYLHTVPSTPTEVHKPQGEEEVTAEAFSQEASPAQVCEQEARPSHDFTEAHSPPDQEGLLDFRTQGTPRPQSYQAQG
jgi:hypothetical protein